MSWFSQDGAKNDSGKFTGIHKVRIIEAELYTSPNNAVALQLRVQFLNRLDSEGNPKAITLDKIWLEDAKGKKPDADRVSAMFALLKADHKKIKKYKVERYDFDKKEKEKVAVPMFEDLMGKVLHLFIQMQNTYPRKKIDPADGSITTQDGIWVPDYDKKHKVSFVFIRAFDPSTNKTFSELSSNKPARISEDLLDRYSDYKEKQMSYEDFYEMVKKRAEEAGMKCGKYLFMKSGDDRSNDALEAPDFDDTDISGVDEDAPF